MKVRVSTIADVSIIVVGIAICLVLFAPGRFDHLTRGASKPYQKGENLLGFDGVKFSESDKALVLYFNSNCHYCREGLEFYRSLPDLPLVRQGRMRFLVVTTESRAAVASFLSENGIKPTGVIGVKELDRRVGGTPS